MMDKSCLRFQTLHRGLRDGVSHRTIGTRSSMQNRLFSYLLPLSLLMILFSGCRQPAPPPAPDFSFSLDPTSLTVPQGGNGTTRLTLTPQDGFTGQVSLRLEDQNGSTPSGLTLSPTSLSVTGPNPVNQGLTVAADQGVQPGTYALRVKGTSGSLTRTANLGLAVRKPDVFIPVAAVLYGSIAEERGGCYPLEELARFSLVDISQYLAKRTSRWCENPERPIERLRSLNPEMIILVYRMSPIEINWAANDRRPVSGRPYFEELRQRHGLGSDDPWFMPGKLSRDYLIDGYYPQYVAMDLGNPRWRRYWIEQGYLDMWGPDPVLDARGASGLFVDGAPPVAYSDFPFCPMSQFDLQGWRCPQNVRDYPDRYWYWDPRTNSWRRNDSLWLQDLFAFIREAVPYYRDRGLMMMFNTWTLTPAYVNLLNEVGGHAMEEYGFVRSTRQWPPNPNHWLARLRNLENAWGFAILNTNAIVTNGGLGPSRMDYEVIGDPNGLRGWDVLWFAMGSFLLGYDPERRNGYFHFTVAGEEGKFYRDTYWFDEYDPRYLNLGKPRGAARQLSSGVWEREFELGWVWVNPTGRAQTVQVPSGRARILNHDNFRDPSSIQPVTQFQLGPWRGVMGLRD